MPRCPSVEKHWPMTHSKLKIPKFFKHYVSYTGAVTEGQQTSNNFHIPMLKQKKKPLYLVPTPHSMIIIPCNFNILYNQLTLT
jgi:hypothetical protein